MSSIPDWMRDDEFVKRAVLSVLIVVGLLAGTAVLLDLSTTELSTERTTVTFEDREREHISELQFQVQTADARSGSTVISNAPDAESTPNRGLIVVFDEPKALVSLYVRTNVRQASLDIYAIDRNKNRLSRSGIGSASGDEWSRVSIGSDVQGFEITATGPDGDPVALMGDDVSFEGEAQTMSQGVLTASLAVLWLVGLSLLAAVTGLLDRLRN